MSDAVPIVVIGAGAAGLVAAWHAQILGAPVLLLEKTNRIGTKILISGGGKCNLTHAGPVESVLKAFRPAEARFLRPAMYRFTNEDFLAWLCRDGFPVMTRPDGRVFPNGGNAKDVAAILERRVREVGVILRPECPVQRILTDDLGICGVQLETGSVASRYVVLAVGGSSYPGTGTTGDGFPWARTLGHTLVPVRAALSPIYTTPKVPEWSGIALRGITLKARGEGKELARWSGDLLFTHHGISGPCALGISREVEEFRVTQGKPVALEIDLRPGESFELVGETLLNWTRDNPRRQVRGVLEGVVPERLIESLLDSSDVRPETPGSQLERRARNRLVSVLKAWPIGIASHVPLEKGEVVAGGISLDEVDPQTMRSRRIRGLYPVGEILDIAGPVGGYNLQAAWSMGYVAGESAAQDWAGAQAGV